MKTEIADDCFYIEFHSIRVACGLFLPPAWNSLFQHLRLPAGHELSIGIRNDYSNEIRTLRKGLFAARLHGDSMIDRRICDGDLGIFQRWKFEPLGRDKAALIEKTGEEEATGSWILKKLVIEKPRVFTRNEFDDDIESAKPTLVVRSTTRPRSPGTAPHWPVQGPRNTDSNPSPDAVQLVDPETLSGGTPMDAD